VKGEDKWYWQWYNEENEVMKIMKRRKMKILKIIMKNDNVKNENEVMINSSNIERKIWKWMSEEERNEKIMWRKWRASNINEKWLIVMCNETWKSNRKKGNEIMKMKKNSSN